MADNIRVSSFAPVFIPTLNRTNHFIKLIESLERCTWAEKTDVYVSLDYPPSDKYEEGHKQIDAYLLLKQKSHGFKQLVIFRQAHNLGIYGNLMFLKQYMCQYDRFILSEDDNVFSPNFLIYINKGLEKYKEDPTVLAICGYRHYYPVKFDDNTFFRQNVDFSAWGYGIMWDKFNEKVMQISPEYFRSEMSFKNFLRVYRNGNSHTAQFLHQAYEQKPYRSDFVIGVMMALEGMDVIMPRKSLVRNMGWDGTGINCNPKREEEARLHSTQEISDEKDFEFVGTGKEYYEENHKIYIESSYEKKSTLYLMMVIFNFFVKTFLRKLHSRK